MFKIIVLVSGSGTNMLQLIKNDIKIDPVDTSQRIIRGKGEPGAKVEIYHNNYGTYNVDVDSSRKLEL